MTAQVAERLIIGGKESLLFTNPLSPYQNKQALHLNPPIQQTGVVMLARGKSSSPKA